MTVELDQREEGGWMRERLGRNHLISGSIASLLLSPRLQKLRLGQWDQTVGNPTGTSPEPGTFPVHGQCPHSSAEFSLLTGITGLASD